MKGTTIVALGLSLLLAAWASQASARGIGVAGDVGLGGLGGVATTTIQSGLDIQEGDLSLGVFGRVRFMLQDDQESGVVRGRDWDEVSDFVHILRYLRYARTFGSKSRVRVQFLAGELLGFTLGHGSLVRDYSNIADPDHPHAGVHLDLSGERWHFASVVDNFISPSVIANRLAVRPVEKLPGLTVGGSLVVDPRAPLTVQIGPERERLVDRAWNLSTDTQPLTLFGLDLEYAFGERDKAQLTPYLDVNGSGHGVGMHVGALGRIRLGKTPLRLAAQLEYRLGSSGYAPAHIETFYDVERYQACLAFADPQQASPEDSATKLAGLVRGDYGGHGVMGQTALHYNRVAQLKLGASYRPGPDAVSLWWRAVANPVTRLQLGVLLMARGLGGPYEGAEGLMAAFEGRYRITDNIYGLAQYLRTWSLRSDTRYFGILQSFNISVGASWSG
jgi:hypothetical protein